MTFARHFVLITILVFGAQAQADDGASKIICQTNADLNLDTKIGFVLPMPEDFEPTGDPPTEIHSFLSAQAKVENDFTQVSIGMWARQRALPDELELWNIVEIDHPKAKDITIRSDIRVKKNGSEVFYYAMIKDHFVFFVRSRTPMDLHSVLDCFV
jgi:hypothetical protein